MNILLIHKTIWSHWYDLKGDSKTEPLALQACGLTRAQLKPYFSQNKHPQMDIGHRHTHALKKQSKCACHPFWVQTHQHSHRKQIYRNLLLSGGKGGGGGGDPYAHFINKVMRVQQDCEYVSLRQTTVHILEIRGLYTYVTDIWNIEWRNWCLVQKDIGRVKEHFVMTAALVQTSTMMNIPYLHRSKSEASEIKPK